MTPREAWRRMWTRADRYHVHGISGAAFTALGAGVLAAWAKRDVDALFTSGSNPAGDAVAEDRPGRRRHRRTAHSRAARTR